MSRHRHSLRGDSRLSSARRAARLLVEPLERRVLLSIAPAGLEFRVNTFTPNTQNFPAMAMDADGDFVVAWQGQNQDGSGFGVFAQRYNASGVPQGDEFRINTHTTGNQQRPSVAMDADGDFVVAWQSNGQDGSGEGVYAQRYNALGVAQGVEFRVNTFTTNAQAFPAVAMDNAGNFVVAWQSDGQDGGGYGVYAQRYNALGVAQGVEFRINTFMTGGQRLPAVAMDAAGNFVVAWESDSQDSSGYGVYAQRYNASGVPQGDEFRVNTFTANAQRLPSAAMDADGDFVVAWQSNLQDGSGNGIYAQRFSASGVAQGGEFRVNTFTTGQQAFSAVAMDADGDFMVAWQSYDQDGYGIYARHYNRWGMATSGEFRANTFTTSAQRFPAVAMNADGDFVVAWQSYGQDGSDNGIYAQRGHGGEFQVKSNHPNVWPLPGPSSHAVVAMEPDGDFVIAAEGSFPYRMFPEIYAVRYNAAGEAMEDVVAIINNFFLGNQLWPGVAVDADGDMVVSWHSDQNDNGDGFDVYVRRFNARGAPKDLEVRANSSHEFVYTHSTMAMDVNGNFVAVWEENVGQDGSGWGIFARLHEASGLPRGPEFQVNTFTTGFQARPAVAMDADGDFVIAWESNDQDGDGWGVYAQRYTAAGVPRGGEFRVNTWTTGGQFSPAVAMDADGDFAIAWESNGQDGDSWGVYAQRYTAAGVPQGGEFAVNTYTTGAQGAPSIAMDADGDFVIAWESNGQDGSDFGIYARRYNALGVPQGAEFPVNSFTTGDQRLPSVGMDANGNFVVAWEGHGGGGGGGVFALRFDGMDDVSGPMIANMFVDGKQLGPHGVLAGPVQQIVVSFSELVSTAGGSSGPNSVTNPANWRVVHHNGVTASSVPVTGITYSHDPLVNRFQATLDLAGGFASGTLQVIALDGIHDLAGNALDGNLDGVPGGSASLTFGIGSFGPHGGEFRVNSFTNNNQSSPVVAMGEDGNFVVVWESVNQDGGGYGIYAQRYDAAGTPRGGEFRVNTFTSFNQRFPAVAMDPNGDFIVTWQSYNQDGSGYGIYAQRYNATGTPRGGEFRVNHFTTNSQSMPAVAVNHFGQFRITWQSFGQDGSENGIYTRYFGSEGGLPGSGLEFRVNNFTTGNQTSPAVAWVRSGFAGDSLVLVVWQSEDQDGSGDGIFARGINFFENMGPEFHVNAFTTGNQSNPAIAMHRHDGIAVVVWESFGRDGDGWGVSAQLYHGSNGGGIGTEFPVNSFTTGNQRFPSVAINADNHVVVAWESDSQDGSGSGIIVQRSGVEFLANTHTPGEQSRPVTAIDAAGNFVVVWTSADQDGSGTGIYAQRFNLGAMPVVDALSGAPDPSISGGPLTLTAAGVTDDQSVLSVWFYRESNGIAGLQFGPGGDTLVGIDDNGGDGWSVAASTTGLAPGTYLYYAQAVDDEGFVGAPASTTHTIIEMAPAVVESEFLFETAPQGLSFTFDQNVGASLDLGDIIVQALPSGPTVNPTSLSYNATTNVATFSFTGILPDTNYRATLLASGITSPGGTPMEANYPLEFFVLAGDANRDRKVDVADLGILASNWQQTGRTFSQADFNYDGKVDVADLGILASNWQNSLPTPSLRVATGRKTSRVIDLVGLT